MDYESNMDLVVFKYSKSGNLMYETAMESNFCFDLVNQLSKFYILGVNSLSYSRNFEVTVQYKYTENYKNKYREIKYDYYSITITDKNASEDGDIGVMVTCKTVEMDGNISLIYNDPKSFEVIVYNEDTINSLSHYYDITESSKDKDFKAVCDTICKLIKICIDNKSDIIRYYDSYRSKYASAYDCSPPEFIDDDEISWQLDPLNKEIREKLFKEFM